MTIQAMQSAALDDHTVVLHIDHAWLNYLPDIMKPIEAILEGSEIPEIFGDDLETIAAPLRLAAQQDGFQESISSYFWKSNLTKLDYHFSFHLTPTRIIILCCIYRSKIKSPFSSIAGKQFNRFGRTLQSISFTVR